MKYLNMEMPIIDLELTSVSQNVSKRFIRSIDSWLDPKVMSVPHISHLVTCTPEELFEHAHVLNANLKRIRRELRRKYGIHFEMTDDEIRNYYNTSLMGRPFGSTHKGPCTMDYLSMRYSLDGDIVRSVAIYQERYKEQERQFLDIAFVQYSRDMDSSGIEDIHEFAAKVISENSMPQQDSKSLEPAQMADEAGKTLNLKQSIETNKVMTHTDLEYYLTSDLGELLRPSKRKAILGALWKKGIKQYKDLCAMKEEDFKSLPFVDDTLLARTKAHLEKYGLRFGMTEDEMLAYMDEEYLAEHPEEAEPVVENAPAEDEGDGGNEYKDGNENKDKEETDEIPQPDPDTVAETIAGDIERIMAEELPKRQDPLSDDYDEKESARFHTMRLLHSTVKTLRDDDVEFMRFRYLAYAFHNQPWYYRFLYSTDERISRAREEADKLFAAYVADAAKCTVYIEKVIRLENKEAHEDTLSR